ncbi:MAG TPA: ABC transporter ATP-binding protein [Candidatus Bipolaricaulis anaerobius]|nr:ABC transporter ATP-binding protein [Candidatus Bipolaricaulis anaerobius]HNS23626.1 ABC transporter ATP-binding protein [Candidatus Bipolaricaulis anaerobius]
MTDTVLEVRNLKVVFPCAGGIIRAVEGIDLTTGRGECVGLVGESGCGKSVTALAIMKLLTTPPSVYRMDKLQLDGQDLTDLSDRQMEGVRGKHMAMIFQDAMTALNPVMTVGRQIDEIYLRHAKLGRREARQRTIAALELVGVPEARSRVNSYPHQLSGGMRQRVLIALAFACVPKLIIADEPTTALDVTIQAQVLDVLKNMQRVHDVSALLITHDLSVIVNMADRVYVMYSGKIVEAAAVQDLFAEPLHPYTQGLLASVPRISDAKKPFVQIPDTVPHPMRKPTGCYFHPRCFRSSDQCRQRMPRLKTLNDGRQIGCWHPLRQERGVRS